MNLQHLVQREEERLHPIGRAPQRRSILPIHFGQGGAESLPAGSILRRDDDQAFPSVLIVSGVSALMSNRSRIPDRSRAPDCCHAWSAF
jgi:hypothetical protein